MRGSRRRSAGLHRLRSSEAGFALVEVMISAVVLLVFATATLSLMDKSTQAAAANRSRVVASNLAHRSLNTMRQMTFSSLGDYSKTDQYLQGAINYTVVSKAEWTTDSNAALTCSSTGPASPYLRISSTVTWPKMGGVRPVTASSLVTPRASDTVSGAGSLVVKVQNATGQPVQGVTVTAQGKSVTSDANGCVIYHFLTAGPTDVTWVKAGYVDPTGASVGNQKVSIVDGQVSTITPSYDVPASITTSFALDNSTTAAKWMSATVTTNGTIYRTLPAPPATVSYPADLKDSVGTHNGLFPTSAGYSAYAGSCEGNDPATYVSDYLTGQPGAAAVPPAGGSANAIAYVKNATVKVSGTASLAGQTVRMVVKPDTSNVEMTGCTEKTNVLTTTRNGSGVAAFTVALPFGVWSVCVDNNKSGGSWRSLTQNDFGVIPRGTPVLSFTDSSPYTFATLPGNGARCA